MRATEAAAFANGVPVEVLMNKAGASVARVVMNFFANPGLCIVFAGKGHNAGNALFAAQCLQRCGWKIQVRLAFKEADCSELMRKKLADLQRRPPEILNAAPSSRADMNLDVAVLEFDADAAETHAGAAGQLIILDGLIGVGAKPPLREPIRSACRSINQLRRIMTAYVFAVDLPTGLDTDSGKTDRDCVVADFTGTIGFRMRGLVAGGGLTELGRL